MSVPFALGYFLWIYHNLANKRSTAASDGISQYVSNKVVLSGLVADNDVSIRQDNGTINLDPWSILADADESSFLAHLRTTFVSVCLKKLIVRVSVLDLSYKNITLAAIEPGGNIDGSCGNHDYAGHGHHTHELSLERLVVSLEFIFVLDGGFQHLFRQSSEDSWDEWIICAGIIIRERTAVHCNVNNYIFKAFGHKCSPLQQHEATATTKQVVQLGIIDD